MGEFLRWHYFAQPWTDQTDQTGPAAPPVQRVPRISQFLRIGEVGWTTSVGPYGTYLYSLKASDNAYIDLYLLFLRAMSNFLGYERSQVQVWLVYMAFWLIKGPPSPSKDVVFFRTPPPFSRPLALFLPAWRANNRRR